MSRRKRKNAITLISLLLATLLLISIYVWYLNRDALKQTGDASEENDQKATEDILLATMDTKLLNNIHYKNPKADIKLVQKDGTWSSESEPERPINQTYVGNIIKLLENVKAVKVINENPDNLGEYGLQDPAVTLEASQSDGKTLLLKLGDKAIGGEGYYTLVNEDRKVYLTRISNIAYLSYSDTDMTAVEGAPVIDPKSIYHITVDHIDNEDFELIYEPDNELDHTGFYSWVIRKPYEEGYLADGSKVSDLLPNYGSFKFISCIDYDSEDLSLYGLEDPISSIRVEYYENYTQTLEKPEKDPNTGEEITVKTYSEEKDFKIYVGNTDNEGNYYVRKEGSNGVYTMKAEEVDKMLKPDPFSIMSTFISIPNIETVNRIDISIDGTPYTMEIKRTKSTNEEGKEETIATYYYNGKEVSEELFKDVYQVMISASYDAEHKGDLDSEEKGSFMTISYHITNKSGKDVTLTTSYLPYDESFYLIQSGRVPEKLRFFADKREIDKVANTIKEFKGEVE